MMQGQVFLKGVADTSYLIFQGLTILHLKITLPFAKLCDVFEEKIFFCQYNFVKKGHPKLSKNEPENIP